MGAETVALVLVCLLLPPRSSASVDRTGKVVSDLASLCSSPLLEDLQELHRVEIREYNGSGYRWQGSTAEMMERLNKHKLLLPETLLQRGVSNLGELTRLEAALQKLASGSPITMVALGGSVSAGHGVKDPGNGWVSRVFKWIEETFPHSGHRLLNHAIPATTSGYISACVPELVPPNTDLVVLEFTWNDYVFGGGSRTINDASRRGLERLLRRLIVHPHRPGVLYVHYWPAARFDPPFMNDEDLVDILLKYYGVPALSLKNALHGLLAATPALMNELWRPADPHPTCIGARMLADLVIGHMQWLVAGIQKEPPTQTNKRLEAWADRQPFLLEHNWGHTHTACVLEEDLPNQVVGNQGWTWKDEGKIRKQHKWGFISTVPGSRLDIRVPLERAGNSSAATQHYLVGIGGLISYEHMGSIQLKCSGGCSCPTMHHTMFHAQNFSMTGWRYLDVERTGTKACIVEVTNSPKTLSGEHKVKISTLMISTKGEVVEGAEGNMLTAAMVNLSSSDTASNTVPQSRLKYRSGDLLNWGEWARLPGRGKKLEGKQVARVAQRREVDAGVGTQPLGVPKGRQRPLRRAGRRLSVLAGRNVAGMRSNARRTLDRRKTR